MVESLEAHLADLSPEFRQVMALRFGQELSYDEMADVLGCSVGTVKSRINRARRQLRESMRDGREPLSRRRLACLGGARRQAGIGGGAGPTLRKGRL